jgi:hypothetical protein
MSQHSLALVFYGIGGVALLFSLIRTYYRVWKIKKETSTSAIEKRKK